MRCRERFLRTLSFLPVDRIPFIEWPIREATMTEWLRQGYPDGVDPCAYFDLDAMYIGLPIEMSMLPPFRERIIEQTEEHKIWQDSLGAVRKDFLRDSTPGFVTRSWLSFPVRDRADFRRMTRRYRADDPGRYPASWKSRAVALGSAAAPLHLSVPWLFWVGRDWMGLEGLCTAFYDEPALVEEMFTFIADFSIEVIRKGIGDVVPDIVELKEDMAYKHAPMISPDMFRSFMLPHYRRLITFLKGAGVRLVYVDCDGDPGDLVPLWIEAGVDAMSPCEAAAGVDPLAIRRRFPRFSMFGGIDKRALARSRAAIHAEVMAKVPPLIAQGGYIPHVDHAIPPDVPLANYVYFREIMAEVAEGRGPPVPA